MQSFKKIYSAVMKLNQFFPSTFSQMAYQLAVMLAKEYKKFAEGGVYLSRPSQKNRYTLAPKQTKKK